jgi:hypothetical protein
VGRCCLHREKDPAIKANRDKVKKVVLCTGKIYYELQAVRKGAPETPNDLFRLTSRGGDCRSGRRARSRTSPSYASSSSRPSPSTRCAFRRVRRSESKDENENNLQDLPEILHIHLQEVALSTHSINTNTYPGRERVGQHAPFPFDKVRASRRGGGQIRMEILHMNSQRFFASIFEGLPCFTQSSTKWCVGRMHPSAALARSRIAV